MSLSDLLMVISTIFIAAATVVNVGVAYKMWEEMHTGGVDTHDLAAAAKAQAEAAKTIAESSKKQAENIASLLIIAGKQAQAAQDNVVAIQREMRQDQRAWISVDVSEKPGWFTVSMHNTGKTPALNTTYVAGFIAGKRGTVPKEDFTKSNSSMGWPEKKLTVTGYVIAPNASQVASDWHGKFADIYKSDAERTYIEGRITYDDVFGGHHETLFCYWYSPPSEFVICNDQNKME